MQTQPSRRKARVVQWLEDNAVTNHSAVGATPAASVSAKQNTEKDFFLRSGTDALLRGLKHARPAWEATHNKRAAAETIAWHVT